MQDDDYEYIDENHRVGVEQDQFTWNDPPTSWGNSVVVPQVRSGWGGRGPDSWIDKAVGDDWINLEGALNQFIDSWGYDWRDQDKVQQTAIRWARIFHSQIVQYDSETNAFWYLPKSTIDYYNDPANNIDEWVAQYHEGNLTRALTAIIEGEINQYHQWGEGEVYVVFGQERHIEHIITKNPETGEVLSEHDEETWDTEESVGGVYFTYGAWGTKLWEEALEYAADSFGEKYTKKTAVK